MTPQKQLGQVKQMILDLLWSMEWVEGKDIFEAVGQTYYDRRIRELRESGWQIQTLGSKYRLLSHEKLEANQQPKWGKPLRIFLCHSSGDKPKVRELFRRLKKDGFAPWLDEENLLPGQDWHQEIQKAVRQSDIVLVCLSKASVNKIGYVQRELSYALDVAEEQPEGSIFIIPAKLEECTIPQRLNKLHWVKLVDDDGYQRLMRSLDARVKQLANSNKNGVN